MRFINIYLVGYFLLVLGGVLALWQAGILNGVSPVWVVIGLIIALGLGIMLAVSSGKPTVTGD